jgi:hypothetical protein
MPYEMFMNRITTVFALTCYQYYFLPYDKGAARQAHRRQFSRGVRSAAVRSCWGTGPSGILVAQPQIEAPPNNLLSDNAHRGKSATS